MFILTDLNHLIVAETLGWRRETDGFSITPYLLGITLRPTSSLSGGGWSIWSPPTSSTYADIYREYMSSRYVIPLLIFDKTTTVIESDGNDIRVSPK